LDALRVARRYYRAWNLHDPLAIRAVFTADGELLDTHLGRTARGDQITAYCRAVFARHPDVTYELIGQEAIDGDVIAIQWRARWGRRTQEGAEFLRVAGDRLRSVRVYLAEAARRPKYQRSGLSRSEAALVVQRLRALLDERHIYRDPELRLPHLAAAVGASTNHVSQALNSHFGASFAQVLARYRVEDAMRLLRDPAIGVLDAGLRAGFASKSSFYAAFKQRTRTTPTAWSARARPDDARARRR
jgi:AraC-like DNA-binding protein